MNDENVNRDYANENFDCKNENFDCNEMQKMFKFLYDDKIDFFDRTKTKRIDFANVCC